MSVVDELTPPVLRRDSLDPATWYVLGLSAALFVGFSAYLVLLYRGYRLHGTDLGRYVHMMATTLHGEGVLHDGVYRRFIPGGSYWGRHFTVTLFLFLPFFALFPSPVTLLVGKSLVLAASVPLLWLVAREHVASDRLAGALVVSYAFNPFLWSAWSFEFQEQVVLPALVFGAYHAYVTERYRRFLALFALVLLTNEHAILIGLGFLAGLAVDAYREGRLGRTGRPLAAAAGLAVAAQALAKYVVSRYSVRAGFARFRVNPAAQRYLEDPVIPVSDLVLVAVRHPGVIPSLLAYDAARKATYFLALLAPVGFLALAEPVALGAMAPWLGFAWLFGGKGSSYIFSAHYPYYLLPFVYLGTARFLGRVSPTGPGFLGRFTLPSAVSTPSRAGGAALVVAVLATNAAGFVVIDGGHLQPVPGPDRGEHDRTLAAAIDEIPADASVVTQNTIYPHVAARPDATLVLSAKNFQRYQRRHGTVSPEYVLYDTEMGSWRPVRAAFEDRFGSEYGLYLREDGIYVYKRGYEGPPRSITHTGSGADGAVRPEPGAEGTVRPDLEGRSPVAAGRGQPRSASTGFWRAPRQAG